MMKLHNTYTDKTEEFKPIDGNKVKMYVCGPTVYDYAHLGHARCYITWDVLYRYLKFKGYDVTYCRNVTDVDDKILKKAEKEGKTPEEVSTYWYKSFTKSMEGLNNLKPDIEPFATKTLGEMISIIKDLIKTITLTKLAETFTLELKSLKITVCFQNNLLTNLKAVLE